MAASGYVKRLSGLLHTMSSALPSDDDKRIRQGFFMEALDTFAARVKWAIRRANTTQSALAHTLSISRNAVSQWCNGGTEPSEENFALAATELRVPLAWLRDGQGEIPGDEDQPRVESSVDAELGRPRPNAVIEVDIRMGAGAKGFAVEAWLNDGARGSYAAEPIAAEWEIPSEYLQNVLRASAKDLRIFPVVGDSMEPRLYEGDRVFLDLRHKVPAPEGIFGLWDGTAFVVKRLQIIRGRSPVAIRIIPENPRYPTEEATIDEVVIIGRLAGRFTTR